MAESDPARRPTRTRRMPDLLTLLLGLVSLGIAASGFAGRTPDTMGVDGRWLLAGGAIALGLVLLAASVRRTS
ncbi:hypothetical protein [Pseudonocardia xishanensis]|uniref:MYXO-CTERM domain-containing protein n=1 Tax=Pseudonocardia xishanensis TaxID=630995 RepID=A0ABP8RUV3_9PSEU